MFALVVQRAAAVQQSSFNAVHAHVLTVAERVNCNGLDKWCMKQSLVLRIRLLPVINGDIAKPGSCSTPQRRIRPCSRPAVLQLVAKTGRHAVIWAKDDN